MCSVSDVWALLTARTHSHGVKCLKEVDGSRVGCCAMSRDPCRQQQKQRVPQTWLCTDSQPMPGLELAPPDPSRLWSVLPRGKPRKPRIQPRKGFVLLIFLFKRTACLAVSYSKCKANNLRTDGVGYVRCDFWWQTSRSLRLDHRLGDRAICWQRDSGSILGNSAGSDSGSA